MAARNEPFAALSQAPASATKKLDAVALSHANRARIEGIFRRLGALGPNTPLVRTRLLLSDGVEPSVPAAPPVSPDAPIFRREMQRSLMNCTTNRVLKKIERRGAPLQFTFTGFEAAQTADFQAFLQTAYPLMVAIYGEPAPIQQGRTVKVQFDQSAGDGFYQLPSGAAGDGGAILYDPIVASGGLTAKQVRDINNYNLTRQILIAFRGPLILNFDAWELGMSDAAALVVNYQAQGARADFDPSQLGSYLLPAYDFFNRPELGNPIFFSANTSPNLGFFRAAVAQAAWLKVYVENPNFFGSFNQSYYAQAGTSTVGVPLAGNTPALKNLAASFAPNVEGLSFADWYRRQYVLDTAITTGEKLWAGLQPLTNLESGDTRSVFFGVVQHYSTDANGQETPLGGTGTVRAFNETGLEVTNNSAELSADNRLVFNTLGEAEINSQNAPANELPIAGFANIAIAPANIEQARLSILFQIGNAQTIAYFPYNVSGTTTAPSGFYGATIGATSGTVQVQVVGGSAISSNLARAAFKTNITYPSGPRVKTNFTVQPAGGSAQTLTRNSAWSYSGGRAQSLGVLLESAPGNSPFALTLSTAGNNKLRMFSLPLTPVQSDEADILGVSPASLLLARYRPNLSPQTFNRDGLVYGVTADKHELYPNISQPFAPGRGYWLKVAASVNRSISGGEPDRAQSFEVPVLGGWNQIGTPFNLPFEVGAIQVSLAGGAPVSFATAINNRWISPGIWRWKPEGGYARVDEGAPAEQLLQPFEGYYIFSPQERGVRLVFNANARTAALSTRAPNNEKNWRVSLSATSGSTSDEDNAFGVSELGLLGSQTPPAAKAPVATRALTLSFHSGGTTQADSTRAGHESGWADSLAAPFEDEELWTFQVDGAQPGQVVRLNWEDVNALPQKLECVLVESGSGKRISMNDARQWSFTASGAPQQFRIEAKVLEPSQLIAYFRVDRFRDSRFAIFTAAFRAAGVVRVQIFRPGGELVKTLAAGQEVEAGNHLWSWNGLDDNGNRVSGSFVARLEFAAPGKIVETREVALELK